MNDSALKFDDFEVDAARRRLLRGGAPVVLSAKAFEVLLALVERRGEVMSKDELLEIVWKGQIVEENNLTVQIAALRKVLGEKKGENRFIATVPGEGYRFVGELAAHEETAIVIENRTIERITVDEIDETPLALPAKTRRVAWPLTALLFILAIAGSIFLITRGGHPIAEVNSLAVLPFAGGDADSEYLSDGLAESVAFSLSRVPGLKVVSQSSAKRYRGADAQKAGSELGVDAILTGRIARRGEGIEIVSELVSTRDNRILWGERFSRQFSDLEKIQADIAASISGKLRLRVAPAEPRGTSNPEAYRLYLQGMYALGKRTPEQIKRSIEYFDQAIAADPSFSQAYGSRAVAWRVLPQNGVFSKEDIRAYLAKAREATETALAIDENIVEAHAVQAVFLREARDFKRAELEFKRAIELNPNYATAHQWYSEQLALLGRHDEAAVEIAKALELDPFSRAVMMNVGLRHLEAGRTDEAIAQFDKLIALEPDYAMAYMFKSEGLIEKGRLAESAQFECRALVILGQKNDEQCVADVASLEAALKTGGEKAFWRRDLELNLELKRAGVNGDISVAAAYLRVGDREKALDLLEKAYEENDPELYYIKVDIPFTKLAGDPRYEELLRKLGI